jgi:hypothetical protein
VECRVALMAVLMMLYEEWGPGAGVCLHTGPNSCPYHDIRWEAQSGGEGVETRLRKRICIRRERQKRGWLAKEQWNCTH